MKGKPKEATGKNRARSKAPPRPTPGGLLDVQPGMLALHSLLEPVALDPELLFDVKVELPELDLEFPDVELEPLEVDLEFPEIDLEFPEVDLEFPEIDLEFPEVDLADLVLSAQDVQPNPGSAPRAKRGKGGHNSKAKK